MVVKQLKKWSYILWSMKWWILLLFFGASIFLAGFWTLISTEVSRQTVIDFVNFCERFFPILTFREGVSLLILGIVATALCLFGMIHYYLSIAYPNGKRSYYKTKMLNQGPKIVVIGGGSGSAMLLKGLKEYTCNITAVVTVGDDGGSSGRLREQYGIIPVGDIRNCIVALSDKEEPMEKLFDYRFSKGNELSGHSLGNLLLLAMSETEGNFNEAINNLNKIFQIRGRVLPVANEPMNLKGILTDGAVVYGETNVRNAQGKIASLELESAVAVNREVLRAIDEADAIILGPGSLYTSIIPNLLVEEVAQHVKDSACDVYYVCNIVTEKGETDDYSAEDHLEALMAHSLHGLIDYVVVNNNLEIAPALLEANETKMVDYDADRLYQMGVKLIADDFVAQDTQIHHDTDRLSQVLIENIYHECIASRKGIGKKHRFRKSKIDG